MTEGEFQVNTQKRVCSFRAIAALAMLPYAVPAAAQWLNYPNPGIPRTADGKAILSAATPRMANGKPDLSGVWHHSDGQNQTPRDAIGTPGTIYDFMPKGAKIAFQPWAEALYKHRTETAGEGRPSEHCLPHGVPDAMIYGGPIKFVQTPGLFVILFDELSHFRQIFMDGRGAAPDPVVPAWYGYSSGKWDGDTLVITTRGFREGSWLDDSGLPHTDALTVTEALVRRNVGHIDATITMDDPKAYTKPFSIVIPLELQPNDELMESLCENEKDLSQGHIK
jgi:hypothetical protein